MKWRAYPSHIDTHVAHLGVMPTSWSVSKVKYVGDYMNGYPFKPEDWQADGTPIIRIQNLSDPEAQFNATEIAVPVRYRVTKGDILISWSASLGVHLWVREFDAWLNQHIFKVTPNQKLVTLGYFLWLGHWFVGELEKDSHGSTMQHLTWGKFGGFTIAIPPKNEQVAIATFLDQETSKLDAMITKQERLVELLKEKRQAVISHLVTKGLNSEVLMKDSGVDWLDKVPAHWEVLPTKRLFQLIVEPAPNDNDCELLSIYTDIGVKPRKELEEKGNKASTTDGYFKVKKRDFIVNKLLAWMGAIGLSQYDGVTSPAYDILRARRPLDERYFDYLWRCGVCFTEFRRHSRGIMDMRLRLYFEDFGQLLMPCPPATEQRQIVEALVSQTARIDDLVAKSQRSINLMQEHRTALIAAAVTGKIDVRSN